MDNLITVEIEQPTELETAFELGGGIVPTGTKQINITSNGTTTEDVTNYADAEITVNVPIPPGYIIPTGTKSISANGTGIDVKDYEFVDVSVSGGGGYGVEDIAVRNYTGDITLSGNTIREYAFAQSGISSINAPNVTSLGNYAFFKSAVESAIFSSLSGQLSEGVFREAKIVEITPTSFPLITRLASYAFAYSTTLTSAVIPNLGNNDTNANGNSIFNGCTNLEVADLGNIYNIPNNTFTNCSKLGVVVLRRNQVLTMGNINAFQNTPYRTNGNTKVIYVPQAQVSSYQTATNWSQLYAANNNVFQPIEGSQYENYYADGTPIS